MSNTLKAIIFISCLVAVLGMRRAVSVLDTDGDGVYKKEVTTRVPVAAAGVISHYPYDSFSDDVKESARYLARHNDSVLVEVQTIESYRIRWMMPVLERTDTLWKHVKWFHLKT